ncbi:hypothetical protein T440DRAFT_432871 [Plenodomus tracheiphilus IPT5]|uniref:Uncharacterized protein n=1 Tax=Plenodomus tracheiphilus IPT5 TaxID=1408161 RepID=A0A6A7AV82_9PLEO|nr:hypothetical protein T440DRAFT_432871 [Plenodomus tracheiphilus IPT5]
MMLTSTYYTPSMPHYSAYAPPRSSPLSERSANTAPRTFDFSMGSPNEKKPTMPHRAYKANPVMQTRDAATKRRRDMFFKRVQNGREDKKWEARGEQIQQLDFVSERKRWEAEKARQAPPEEHEIEEDLIDDATLPELPQPRSAPQPESWMTEADWVAAQEEYELQQLIASMEPENDTASHHYGSDDVDYDSIFMECATSSNEQHQYQPQHTYSGSNDMDMMDMDMTDG